MLLENNYWDKKEYKVVYLELNMRGYSGCYENVMVEIYRKVFVIFYNISIYWINVCVICFFWL